MENIPPNMVIHKHVDGSDNIFSNTSGPLLKNPLVKCLGLIRIGTHQAADEEIRWEYESVSYLWPYIETYSESSDDRSGDKGRKYQDNPYYQ